MTGVSMIELELRDEDKKRVDEAASKLGVDSIDFVRKAVGTELVLAGAVEKGAEVLLKYPNGTWGKVRVK